MYSSSYIVINENPKKIQIIKYFTSSGITSKLISICLTECKVGTVAIDGSSCRPCANNTYGTKCIGRCNCKHQERSDFTFIVS